MKSLRKLMHGRECLWWRGVAHAFLLGSLFCVTSMLFATQTVPSDSASQSVELDHVVAIVAEQAILQSDVEDEMRFTALQSTALSPSENTPQKALNRLIDRALIDNERALQPSFSAVSDAQVQQSIVDLKKNLSACAYENCSTEKGWQDFLHKEGFTPQEIFDRMREQLQVLKFIDWRFGSTVRISQKDEQTYYQQVLLPQFARAKVPAPPLKKIAVRIREILLQQHITGLLDDWLKSLRHEGEVHIVDPTYADVGGTS